MSRKTIKFRVCCPHDGCEDCQGAVRMFKGYGIEPGLHADGLGHYLMCHWPKHLSETDLVRFAHDMMRRTNVFCSCGKMWTRRGGTLHRFDCKRCGTKTGVCDACRETWDFSLSCDKEDNGCVASPLAGPADPRQQRELT